MRFPAIAALCLAACPALAGPFEGWPDASGNTAPFHKAAPAALAGKPWKLSGGRPVQATVTTGKTLAPITPYFFGNNLSWWMGKAWSLDQDRLDKARQAGIRFWRFPGGSSSDEYRWDGLYASHPNSDDGKPRSSMNAPQQADTDDFISICRATDAQPMITANYGLARYGSLAEGLELAASWVRHTNMEKKFKVRYWEVGNELYGDWETGHNVKGKAELGGAEYGRDFREYAKAMKAVDPDVYVGAVAIDQDNGEAWSGFKWWMRDMLPEAAKSADYLIWHEYFVWPFEKDGKTPRKIANAELFHDSQQIGEGAERIRAMALKYGNLQKALPIALTEYNIVNGVVPQTLQLINALFTAEVIGESIKHGLAEASIWDWRNGYDPALGGGDHAMLSSGEPGLPDDTPRPTFYAYALLSRVLGERLVQAESNDPQVKVYASVFQDGALGLVVVNEREEDISLQWDLGGFQGRGQASLYAVTGSGLNSKKVSYNGVAGKAASGGPFPIDSLPPYSLKLNPGKPLKLSLPKASLCGLILR
jgi:hypothetical protein